jgi:hypothetical protein
VLTRFFAAAGRHRRVILVIALTLAAGYLLVQIGVPSLGRHAFPVLAPLTGVLLLLGIIALAWAQPRAFVVRPGVFSAGPHPTLIFMALAFVIEATGMAGNVIRDRDDFLELTWVAILALWIALAWRDPGAQLRPDGIRQRGLTGWLVVPWEAEPALSPPWKTTTMRIAYGRPELVRRTGLHVRRNGLVTQGIDPWLLGAAIHHYVNHPEHHAAIGTPAEYDRLMAQLLDAPTATEAPTGSASTGR